MTDAGCGMHCMHFSCVADSSPVPGAGGRSGRKAGPEPQNGMQEDHH